MLIDAVTVAASILTAIYASVMLADYFKQKK